RLRREAEAAAAWRGGRSRRCRTPQRKVCTGDPVELVDDDENAVLRHLLLRDRGDNVRKYGREVCRGSSRLRLCLASEDFPMPRFPTIAMLALSDTSAR